MGIFSRELGPVAFSYNVFSKVLIGLANPKALWTGWVA
jgi:hypothetical protein